MSSSLGTAREHSERTYWRVSMTAGRHFLYIVCLFRPPSACDRSISSSPLVHACASPPPPCVALQASAASARVVTDGAKAGPMANLIGLRWCHHGGHRWTHEYPFDTNYRQWAPGGGAERAKHFGNQKIQRRLRGHWSIIYVQSNRFQKSVVNSQNYFPRLL